MARRRNDHSHPCTLCSTPVFCDCEMVENYDGFPEVICPAYHLPGGGLQLVLCPTCEAHEAARAAADEAENIPEDLSPEAVIR